LLGLLKEAAAYRQLVGELATARTERKTEVLDAARPYFIAALYEELNLPMMVLTAQPEGARKLYEQLELWCPRSASLYRFPELDLLPYEHPRLSGSSTVERLQVLAALTLYRSGDRPPLIISSALGTIIGTIPREDSTSACHTLEQGMFVDPFALLRQWQEMGYEFEDVVEVPGQLSKRGGIIDVFPVYGQSPVRIEFFANRIESMRLFNPETQCSTEPISSVTVTPAKEILGVVHPGQVAEDGSGLTGNILDYLDSHALIILDAPGEIRTAVDRLNKEAQELEKSSRESGDSPQELPPRLTWQEFESKMEMRGRLTLEHWRAEGEDRSLPYEQALSFRLPQSYGGRLERFLEIAKQAIKTGQRLIIVSHQANRLAELLQGEGIYAPASLRIDQVPLRGSVTLVQGSLAEGWVLNGELNLLTDAELFGFVKQPRPSKKVPVRRQWLVPRLVPGDYVVHVDHGIGKFTGLTRLSTDGAEREYLVLHYAAGDKLYVPTDQIGRISRYIGASDQAPTLSRLGTQEWQRTKKRVEESVADVAKGLLDLYATREVVPGFAFSADTLWQQELEASFPYMETPDQIEAVVAVKEDMEKPKPMDRLICGDVGYGKTEVVLRAAFKAVMDNKQVAILVPTTVLAQQHFATFGQRLQAFPVRIEMLSRFCSQSKEIGTVEGLARGTVDICIGTHRLLQKDVCFRDLGLVIIDEEQRFGVVQKEKLKQMREEVDVLTLSATPIPRTLHMSLTGIKDMSIMETPPEERLSIKTYIGAYDDTLVRQAILRELERNGQVFFVHNRVQSIALVSDRLQKLIPEAKIVIAHGQMPEEKLESVMADFVVGRYDVLVTTTIIQLGLDMPNVNTLIVNQADKFGLTQLYQLRGRVGRGTNQAYAYFLFDKGKQLTHQAHKRLRTIFEATELSAGFGIAMKDLEIRGAGNLLGVRQSGHIAAVGFELYCQMLAEAVEELRAIETGETKWGRISSETRQAPSIALPLTAYIPEEYVPNLDTRLGLYRRLAAIEQTEGVRNIAKELRDRFGTLPQPVQNLLQIVEIKILAANMGVESIHTQGKQVVLNLARWKGINDLAPPEEYKDAIRIGTRQVRLNIRQLGGKWQEALERLLKQ
jgi:transcription-repair coupling factor (superfamily II helicase)